MLQDNKRLMAARLGLFENDNYKSSELLDGNASRLNAEGGHSQQNRMIQAKRKTLERALYNSYQAAQVKKDGTDIVARALINPNVVKQDYDDKVISIGYEFEYKPGDVFEWIGTNTRWIIYLQDLTELAYFKGDIRKCNYSVKWENAKEEICQTWFAVRGPVETNINFVQKGGISVDVPNHSLNILMPKTEETLEYFQRYAKFYVTGAEGPASSICWRVEAVDSFSMPGILQINAIEYYANETEDDIENGVVGGLVSENIEPDTSGDLIQGNTFIKPKMKYLYEYVGTDAASWSVDSKYPVEITKKGDKTIELSWTKTFSGEFVLKCSDFEKTIIVESLF